MSTPTPSCISVTTTPTFWDSYVASFVLLRYRWPVAIFLAFYPLGALFLLMTPLMGYRLGMVEILLALAGFSFIPLMLALLVWLSRRRSMVAQGQRTFLFNAEGIHVKGATFSQTIMWPAIFRIRHTRKFLFIFISPTHVYGIPLKAINDPHFLDNLRSIAGARTDFGA